MVTPAEQRAEYYDTLFRGELPYEPLPDDAYVGIAGLCRATRRSGSRSQLLNEQLGRIPFIVSNVLLEHDLMAASDESSAIFAFVNDEARERVGNIVTEVFTQWEVTHSRNKLDILLPSTESEAKWLVIETAAAAMQVILENDVFDSNKNISDDENMAKLIASWGPKFISQWFDGTILNHWSDQHHFSEEERGQWLEVFTPGLRKRFADKNIGDPLNALERVKEHLEVTLTDAAIAERLGWSEEEVAGALSPSIRKHFAVNNITDPMKGLEAVKEHLEITLTSVNIAQRLGWSTSEVDDIFTSHLRKVFAVSNISNPLQALERVKKHLEVTLTDAAIAERLGWSEEEVAGVFTPGLRKGIAVRCTDPLDTIEVIKTHLEVTLTDAAIAERLGWSEEEVAELVSPSIRKQLAASNIIDPLNALEVVKYNLEVLLTDAAIAERLGWSEEEVAEVFTTSLRKLLAINNRGDPLKASERIKEHLEVTLTDANIAEQLGWSKGEVIKIFIPSIRGRIAVNNPSNPLKALGRIKQHLEVTLTDASIAESLCWSEERVVEVFTPGLRKRLAVHNSSDPLKASERIKKHLEITLTDAAIAERLGWSEERVAEVFTLNVCRALAVSHVRDPLQASKEWVDGNISLGNSDAIRDKMLQKMSG